MAAVRRHLASLGLAVVLCHLVMQVLVPAALCCEKKKPAQVRAEVADCCEGAHPGQICPMHKDRSASESPGKPKCGAQPKTDLHNLFIAFTSGGMIVPAAQVTAPAGSEATPVAALASIPPVFLVPLGPPPRV